MAPRSIWILALVACGAPASPRPPIARPQPDAAVVASSTDAAVTCDVPDASAWGAATSFLSAAWVPHLRVVAAVPSPTTRGDRCVALELELLDAFRGDVPEARAGHIHLVIRQSMVTSYTSRPAGAWWIVEQSLEVGSEYVAFCPAASIASLRASCMVSPAPPLIADVTLLRELEATHAELDVVVARERAACATSSGVAATYLWDKFGAEAVRVPKAYDLIVSLVEEPACGRIARATLFDAVQDPRVDDSPPHVHRLARAMFHLLAMPEAADLHENLIGTYLPNTLGLVGGSSKQTVATIFGTDAKARAAAIAAVRDYHGPADTAALRAWLGLPRTP